MRTVFLFFVFAIRPVLADVVSHDFEGGFGDWEPLFSGDWISQDDGGNTVAVLTAPGLDRPPVRRPRAYLFLQGYSWEDYVFTVKGKTLEPASNPRRDICLIFGYQDDTHYYYAHLSNQSDGFHNIIMRVDGTTRVTIHNEVSPPSVLTGGWQTFRVEHDSSGMIRVYVDDLSVPHLTASDSTYPAGAVAFGCFDDRGEFDDATVSGTLLRLVPPITLIETSPTKEYSLKFATEFGFTYFVRSGVTLPLAVDRSQPILGDASEVSIALDPEENPVSFFQLEVVPPLLAIEPE